MSKKVFVQSISNCFCTALLMVTMADQLVQSVEVIARKWLDEQPKGKVKHELKLLINKDATDLLSSGAIQRFNAQLQNVMLENEQDIVMNISYRYKEVLKPMDARLRYGVSHVLDAAKVNKNRTG